MGFHHILICVSYINNLLYYSPRPLKGGKAETTSCIEAPGHCANSVKYVHAQIYNFTAHIIKRSNMSGLICPVSKLKFWVVYFNAPWLVLNNTAKILLHSIDLKTCIY